MPAIPLPFIVSLALLVLLARLTFRHGDGDRPVAVLVLLGALALQAALIGLRWGYGVTDLGLVQALMAAALPPLVYFCFSSLAAAADPRRPWLHAVPAALIALAFAVAPPLVDAILVGTALLYAAGLWRLSRAGPDGLSRVPIEGAWPTHRALQAAAGVLALSALTDTVVALDIARTGGIHAGAVVGAAHLAILALLGSAVAVAGRAALEVEGPPVLPVDDPEDPQILARIEALIEEKALYREPELSLDRLARKAGIPARRISAAINRLKGQNISQFINDRRVAEACRLLTVTDDPVTAVMFSSGFQTKSNFNREFRRVTGTSPTAWRTAREAGASLYRPANGTSASRGS